MISKFSRFRLVLLSSLVSAVSLAGCAGSSQPSEQVVAEGNDFELTIHEYDQALRQSPAVTAEAVQPMRKAILEALIDEKLLADRAMSSDLDKTSSVAQELQAAKRSILAKAFVQQLTGGTYKPSEQDLRQYYQDHPLQFAGRKRFVVSEVVLKSDLPNIRDYLTAFEKDGFAGLSDLGETPGFRSRPAPITVVRFSDDIVGPATANVPRLSVGSQVVYQTVGQVHLGLIRELAEDPLPFEEARPAVTAGLLQERNAKLVKAAVKKERDDRKVAIVSDTLKSILGMPSVAQK
ncbi:EpsD family peptidyl-prolyl cis-trans isomerase [Novosphingobium aquimarinum]|uniref:EpsD family peptidyl-prolyl cis-trans isomerase n=1 Tax=Novosphingobium aquimarinum TaxID=2682494 RepID=UPI0012EB102F|nr:EpsD family peptidyl-prolyl cis-trans isomerase [Novosphingobium aquimarinum]